MKSILFNEHKLNQHITLKNKLLMAPMTRVSASNDHVPTQAMVDYYARRATAGLIVTEGTIIIPEAKGHDNVPGIFNNEQINKWKQVTDQVHHHEGQIFLQIWHVGRVSHPYFLNGDLPISASATLMTGSVSRSSGLEFGLSRAATKTDMTKIIDDYANAAKNAIKAGFDGVEIHGANGYLIDQFLHYNTNLRDDEYGGSPDRMTKFALDVVKACGDLIDYERVGLRLSPGAYLNQIIGDQRDEAVFKHLLEQLNPLNLAYVHTGNFDDSVTFPELSHQTMTQFIRSHYQSTVIACGGYIVESAEAGISRKEFDLAALGRPFIANPDLIQRIESGHPLKSYDVGLLASLY